MNIVGRIAALEALIALGQRDELEPVTFENYRQSAACDLSDRDLWDLSMLWGGNLMQPWRLVAWAADAGVTASELRRAMIPDLDALPALTGILRAQPWTRCVHTFAQFEEAAAERLGMSREQFAEDYATLIHALRQNGAIIETPEEHCPQCWARLHGVSEREAPEEIRAARLADYVRLHELHREQTERYVAACQDAP